MQRDMDLVREIAKKVAEMPPGGFLEGMSGVDPHLFGFHVKLMLEAGLVEGSVSDLLGNEPPIAFITRLTWDGCEFLDQVRDPGLWAKAKETVIKPTASFSFELLKGWLKAELQQSLPSVRSLLP